MTDAERDAVRQEMQEASEAMWRVVAEHGDPREEWAALFGNHTEDAEHDAA